MSTSSSAQSHLFVILSIHTVILSISIFLFSLFYCEFLCYIAAAAAAAIIISLSLLFFIAYL